MDTQEESTFIQLFNLSGRRYSIKYDRGSPQHGWIFYDNDGTWITLRRATDYEMMRAEVCTPKSS